MLAESLAWSPQLDCPFGRSRISRPVMAITDNTIRFVVRGEGATEFFAAPRIMALGVSEDAFKSSKCQAAIECPACRARLPVPIRLSIADMYSDSDGCTIWAYTTLVRTHLKEHRAAT